MWDRFDLCNCGANMFCCSVKLVEQELWQKEEKGLIGVLPVRDTEATGVGSMIAPGDSVLQFYFSVDTVTKK